MTTKLVAEILADLERFRDGEPTLDVENILDLIAAYEQLQAQIATLKSDQK